LLIWGLIIIFSQPIAELVGSPNESSEIAVAGCCIPLAAFSSIQMALYKRGFDFKTLFYVRIVGVLIPLFVTVPLALYFRNCWALILGVIAQNFSNALLLTLKSPWKPNRFYSFAKLKEMFSFSMWTLVQYFLYWITANIGFFLIGRMFSPYFLGLYRTATTIIGQINSVVTSATTPVLYSSLSRVQSDMIEFKNLFFKFQKLVGMLVFPVGVILYLFRTFFIRIILGSQWIEISDFFGLWAIATSFAIVFSQYCSFVFLSLGKLKILVEVYLIHMLFLIPILYFSVKFDFYTFCFVLILMRLHLVLVNLIMINYKVKISIFQMFTNVFPSFLASMALFVIIQLLPIANSIYGVIFYLLFSIIIYLVVLVLFKEERFLLKSVMKTMKLKICLP
jgi:PST family polysaccharide transporter